jgi:hypothetical protein
MPALAAARTKLRRTGMKPFQPTAEHQVDHAADA